MEVRLLIRKSIWLELKVNIMNIPSGDDVNPYGNGQNPWIVNKPLEVPKDKTDEVLQLLGYDPNSFLK